ncbi:Phage capsid family protein [Gemmata obscuriglobus]|uniref:Phage major capsid protein n=1 Tax=Gemmata obscuriglobus TaxID=114 RepID=A0A2Z3GYB7_9BACT|nr:phage major capsid protein [Gemmata obscuriglobus]AWM37032.1 phage major capsid protein [Gemmata obscuriglobus]QEG30262.1 Phage capsid family protein [Gemmata obscuriglobus]VTS09586.1 Phage major capsid protein OS=Azospirillum phage Cd GN=33 PE=4 SV=1: Phage_capsid [Gemmata obscuriglobus UQM 2246]
MEVELQKSVEGALLAFEALKTDFTDIKGKMKNVDGFDQAKFAKMAEDIAKGIDVAQKVEGSVKALDEAKKAQETALAEIKEKNKLLEEKQALIETALSRPISVTTEDAKSKGDDMLAKSTELFNEFARKGAVKGEDYTDYLRRTEKADDEARTLALKTMSVNSDPDGGYLVIPTLGGTITTLVRETSPMRQLASVQTIGSDSLEYMLDNDEAGAGWVGETQPRPETTTPRFSKLVIPVNEIYAQPKATQKLIDDAVVDIEAWLAEKVAQKFARMENTAFMSGDGVMQPRGILTYPNGTSGLTVEQVITGAASAFAYDGLVNLQSALKEEYQGNASWLVNRLGFGNLLLLLKDLNGTPIFNMQYDMRIGLQRSILGAPLYFATDMPTVATNALAAIYGDFKRAYQIVDRTGIRILRDPFTDKPFVKFYTTKRVGGALVNGEAIKIAKIAAS